MNKHILITTGIYPPDIGGPATILPVLSKDLENKGLKIKILTFSTVASKREERGKIWRVIKNRPLSRIIYLIKLVQLSLGSDIIYATDVYGVGYLTYIVSQFLRKKYVVRFVGDSAWEISLSKGWVDDDLATFQTKRYSNKVEKLRNRRTKILKNADLVVTVSRYMSDITQKIGIASDKIQVIYNSIDFIQYHGIDNQILDDIQAKYGQDSKIIMTACRLIPWKGVETLIKITHKLNAEFGRVNLLVLGDGPELDKLKSLVHEMKLENRVHFLGKIDHAKVASYYKAADLFILNTKYEGMSHTLLEVIKVGTPVAASSAGGNPEIIENNHTGILFKYNNIDQIFNVSKKLLTDDDLAKSYAANGQEKIRVYNWKSNVDETYNMLVNL